MNYSTKRFPPTTPTPYVDPIIHFQGYTEPDLQFLQHAAVIGASSVATAIVQRPISQLGNFSFLTSVPGDGLNIAGSDKRGLFFQTLFGSRWLQGTPFIPAVGKHVVVLSVYAATVDALRARGGLGRWEQGALAGAVAGVALAAILHPVDVLRVSADAPNAPRKFTGPLDVFLSTLKHKPAALLGLYRGFSIVVTGYFLQYMSLFWWYHVIREDAVSRSTAHLFFGIYLGACVGPLVQYPLHSLKQSVRSTNNMSRLKTVSYRAVFMEMKRRHGMSKVYDGFFRSRPFLTALPTACLVTLYDVWSRRYTEFLHPEAKKVHSEPKQRFLSFPFK